MTTVGVEGKAGKIKVLVVDDTIFYRKIVSDILGDFANVEVVGSANNGEIAMSRIRTLKPDLLTLDVEMPVMNGLQVLEKIRDDQLDVDCLMLSSKTEKGGEITMEALALGAFDFVLKPDEASPEANRTMLSKDLRLAIQAYSRRMEMKKSMGGNSAALVGRPAKAPAFSGSGVIRQGKRNETSQVIAIGVSTGGPIALATLLSKLPSDIGVPILLVQHMPAVFTSSLAKSLDKKCLLPVKEAVNGEAICKDTVYIAPGGKQMKVASGAGLQKIIRVMEDPPENNCLPAADYLFRSVAREYGSKATCVIMTGMGVDGKLGLIVAKSSGAMVIAQDEASCVVFGMPKVAIEAGVTDVVAPLDELAGEILKTI